MIWNIFLIAVIVVVILFLLLKVRPITKFIENNASRIAVLSLLISLLGVITIITAVISLSDRYEFEQENKIILLQNLDEEIIYNLEIIQIFNSHEMAYKSSNRDSFSPRDFRFHYLMQSRDVIRSSETRKLVFGIISEMEIANNLNHLLVARSRVQFPGESAKTKYVTNRNQNIDGIISQHSRISEKLLKLKTVRDSDRDVLLSNSS